MSSTYSTNLAIELIGTGDQAGSWGNTTNTNLGTLVEQAISGYVTQAVSTGTDTTITIPNGATGVARNMYIELTGTGGASTNLIVPANKKLYFIFNNTSSGQVTVKVSGQTGVSVPNKAKMILVSNGTDIVDATNYIGNISAASANITVLTSASATITNLIATSASITTLTNNPTFSAGTANGVLYLNGSKVATSGSALTFDGTNLGVGTASPTQKLTVAGNILSLSAAGTDGYVNAATNGVQNTYLGFNNSGSTNAAGALNNHSYVGNGNNYGVQIISNGSAVATFTNTYNVGIGTASPGYRLHVVDNSTGTQVRVASSSSSGTSQSFINTATNGRSYRIGSNFVTGTGEFALYDDTAAAARLTVDSSGNLGLGVTPSAWSGASSNFQLVGGAFIATSSSTARYGANYYYASGYKYTTSDYATLYQQAAGQHQWYTAPSGTAGNAITFTQAMTLDASGNLLVGTTSARTMLTVAGSISIGATPAAGVAGTAYSITGSSALSGNAAGGNLTIEAGGGSGATANGNLILRAGQTVSPLSITTGGNLILESGKPSDGQASGYIGFNTYSGNPSTATERARITSGGNFGINTTDPTQKLEVAGGIASTGTDAFFAQRALVPSGVDIGAPALSWRFYTTGTTYTTGAMIQGLSAAAWSSTSAPMNMVFYTVPSGSTTLVDRGRFTAGGNFFVGCQNTPSATVEGFCATGTSSGNITSSGSSTSAYNHWVFYNGNGLVGSISTSGSATAYNTSSDIRLKKNIVDSQDAGTYVDALKVRAFDWKVDDSHVKYGFVAQELAAVAPEAVKVGDDGEEITDVWGVDYSKLVPMLVKELQSVRARLAALEAK